jgi:hypothetical protein
MNNTFKPASVIDGIINDPSVETSLHYHPIIHSILANLEKGDNIADPDILKKLTPSIKFTWEFEPGSNDIILATIWKGKSDYYDLIFRPYSTQFIYALEKHKEYMTEDNAIASARIYGNIIKDLKTLTHSICIEAVKQCGSALQYVSEQYRTQDICIQAVKQNGRAIKYVPDKYITHELCLIAVKTAPAFSCIPIPFRTYQVALAAITYHPHSIWLVENKHITSELVEAAYKALDATHFNYHLTPSYCRSLIDKAAAKIAIH